jgi:hypothetical protein
MDHLIQDDQYFQTPILQPSLLKHCQCNKDPGKNEINERQLSRMQDNVSKQQKFCS